MLKHRAWVISAAVIILIVSLMMMAYPLLSDWYAGRQQQEIVTAAVAKTKDTTVDTLQTMKEAAQCYNRTLCSGVIDVTEQDYASLLNVTDDGLMGILEIPGIHVTAPIYHGTEPEVLAKGIGHVYGTSLPVGGVGTHAALSGHSGMAGQRMLTDLVSMEIEDVFYIRILGETLTYRVDQIKTVLPSDVSDLAIDSSEDYITLITCTPYGINTHRLLVRGVRVPDAEGSTETSRTSMTSQSSAWKQEYGSAVLTGMGIAGIVSLMGLVVRRYLWKHHRW